MEQKVKESVEQALQQRDYEQEIQTLTEQVDKLEKQSSKDTITIIGLWAVVALLLFVTLNTFIENLKLKR